MSKAQTGSRRLQSNDSTPKTAKNQSQSQSLKVAQLERHLTQHDVKPVSNDSLEDLSFAEGSYLNQ